MADPVFRSAYDFLAPSPDATYGAGPAGFFAQNRPGSAAWVQEGDNTRLSIPDWLRSAMQGVVGLGESTQTGTLSGDALKVLTTVGPGTGAALAPRNSVGVFGGRLSQTADQQALQRAKNMESYSPDQVWDKTGWGRGPDQRWRYEIDDQPAKYLKPDASPNMTLPNVLEHPELFAAYPDLKNVRVAFTEMPAGSLGSVGQRAGDGTPIVLLRNDLWGEPERARNVLLHEVQHLVQNREGFSQGGSLNNLDLDSYRRLAGEVEARNVEGRSTMGPATRREFPPWQTHDVPTNKQTVGFNVMGQPIPAPGFRVAKDMVY